jgi:hypothetical protein
MNSVPGAPRSFESVDEEPREFPAMGAIGLDPAQNSITCSAAASGSRATISSISASGTPIWQ